MPRLVMGLSARPVLLGTAAWAFGAACLPAQSDRRWDARIEDNSFLIEEAYNQEEGVVQHISNFLHDLRSTTFVYSFTQEWPLGGMSHQLSYTIPIAHLDQSDVAFGDIRLNYRYQLVGNGEAKVAIAPRITALLPTGNVRHGDGQGGLGIEAWLPASVLLGSRWTVNGNLGALIMPSAQDAAGDHAAAFAWSVGGSGIWRAGARVDLLVEALGIWADAVVGDGVAARALVVTISPGVRWAYDFRSGLQIVPGVAFPIGVGPNSGERGIFLYLSFEHPFTRAARERAEHAQH